MDPQKYEPRERYAGENIVVGMNRYKPQPHSYKWIKFVQLPFSHLDVTPIFKKLRFKRRMLVIYIWNRYGIKSIEVQELYEISDCE